MNNNDEKSCFADLLKKYHICIPMIQRDYAHGRTDTKTTNVRENLISDILNCLRDNNNLPKTLDFNFVYGTISVSNDDNNVFYPVDGQQRLTTLYLVSWYLAVRCDENSDTLDKFLDSKHFRYETRSSADEFFRQLREVNKPDANGKKLLYDIVRSANKTESLKSRLEYSTWFRQNWITDPTVQSAVTVLDHLNNKLNENDNIDTLYKNLDRITFQLETEDNKENAETNAAKSYLRMNARGKPLDDFENLKAMLDKIDSSLDKSYDLTYEYDTCYINKLFDDEESENDLSKKTKNINIKSLNIFRNLYNLCRITFTEKTDKLDSAKFIQEIHSVSRKSGLESRDSGFFKKYIRMLMRVMDLYCNLECSEECKETHDTLTGLFNDICDLDSAAPIVLCAMYKTSAKDKSSAKEIAEQCSLMIYISKNLENVIGRKDAARMKILNTLAENSGSIGILAYFKEAGTEDLYAVTGCNEDNTKKAIVWEQKLKAEIICNNCLDPYWFKTLEEREFSRRRVQYLLCISGYWNGIYDEGTRFKLLKEYHKCAEKFFFNDENSLEWKRLWAVSYYFENEIQMSHTNIDKDCEKYKPWVSSFYHWDSPSAPKSTENLDRIKQIYDNCKAYENACQRIASGQNCWLKFAVNDKDGALLSRELEYIDGNVTFSKGSSSENSPVRYFDVAVCQKNTDNAEFDLKQFKDDKEAKFTYHPNTALNSGDDTINIILHLITNIEIENLTFAKEECVYTINDTLYTVYHRSGGYHFERYVIDLSAEFEQRDKYVNEFEQIKTKDDTTRKAVITQHNSGSGINPGTPDREFKKQKGMKRQYEYVPEPIIHKGELSAEEIIL